MLLLASFMYGCSGSSTPEVKKPSMTNQISKDLGMSKSQTEAGLGAMMMLSKNKLSPDDFSKLSGSIPGTNDLINKATDLGVVPGSVGTTADIIQVLSKLGVSPVTAAKFVPEVLKFTKNLGGGAFGLLSKVF
jgi:hypothetical protein